MPLIKNHSQVETIKNDHRKTAGAADHIQRIKAVGIAR